MGFCSAKQCIESIKKYEWLLKEVNLKNNTVAILICDYINTHKWFLNESIPFEVTFDQAVFSWYENAYRPIISALYKSFLIDTIDAKSDDQMAQLLEKVSDTHFLNNNGGGAYTTYETVCYRILFSTKGHFFTKVRALLLS